MSKQEMTHEQRAYADAALANRLNVVHHAYVDICGDLVAGALLGQVLYWFGADRNGQTRARIVKQGHYWIAKTRADWWDEIRISPKQYDRAAKILKDKGFIEIKTMKFAGNPTTHIRIVPQKLNAALDAWKWDKLREAGLAEREENRAAVGFSPFGDNGLPQTGTTFSPDGGFPAAPMVKDGFNKWGTSLTEITAEPTKEITAESTCTFSEDEIAAYFDEIWAYYPRKEGRAKAFTAFSEAVRGGENPESVLVKTALYKQYAEMMVFVQGVERRYIPTGGTWFSERRWIDEAQSISSTLDFDDGLAYNKTMTRLRSLADQAKTAGGELCGKIRAEIGALLETLPY